MIILIGTKKVFSYLITLIAFFLFFFSILSASGNATSSVLSSSNQVYVGDNVSITIAYTGFSGVAGNALSAASGTIKYDTNYLEYVSYQSLAPFPITYNADPSKSNGFDSTGSSNITGYSNIIKVTFRTKKIGDTTISYVNGVATDKDDSNVNVSSSSKSISIVNRPSANNNLSSLSVSVGSIQFSPSQTSYSINVKSDISSITINASPEDSGASVSGTGSKSLNYGNNTFQIIVKAPSGDTKTYTVKVYREDVRSKNNNLSKLSVEGGTISPVFDSNTLIYEVSVPFTVENLKVNATKEDSKAKVTISNQNGLVAEETREVLVVVTAENGSKKTYTIKVTRGKDPNKVLSNDNNLSSLTTDVGILSPAFDKDKTDYIIYLPYEVDKINIDAVVQDTRYGVLEKDVPETLQVGSNKLTFSVKAEDESVKVYTVTVVRANLLGETLSVSTFLKSLEVKNGSLDRPYDKNVNVYRYSKKKGFKVLPTVLDENSKLTVIDHEDVISIIVESDNDVNVYTLIPEDKSLLFVIIISVLASLTLAGGSLFLGYKLGFKKIKKFNNIKEKTTVEDVKSDEIISNITIE